MPADHAAMFLVAPCRIIARFQQNTHVCDRWRGLHGIAFVDTVLGAWRLPPLSLVSSLPIVQKYEERSCRMPTTHECSDLRSMERRPLCSALHTCTLSSASASSFSCYAPRRSGTLWPYLWG